MTITVVTPCRNEERNIRECIEAIYASEVDGDEIEVLVIDGMSTDGTPQELKRLKAVYPSLRMIPNALQVTPVALNIGIREARGQYIQIVGARQIISRDYLRSAKAILEGDPQIWCVGGAVVNVYQDEDSRVIGLAMASPFGVGGGNFRTLRKSGYVDTVGTPMYRRSVFDRIGLFNEALVRNQDDELNYRITARRGRIYLNADVHVKYYVRANLGNLFTQYLQYGYWKVYANRLHHTVTTARQLVPLGLVLGLTLGFLSSLLVPSLTRFYLLGISLYATMALLSGIASAGAVMTGLRVALVFPVLHFAYGWGYLRGIIDVIVLNRTPAPGAARLSR
jgi:glycosyltransferase involved in cell wall biosynthesis